MNDDRLTPATRDDYEWWWRRAREVKWTWAKTYADFAPHWYVVEGRTPGLSHADFIRAGRVIRTFGEPGRFFRFTNLYLYNPERTHKVWCMWDDTNPQPEDADLINLAHTDRTYGAQTNFDRARIAALRLPRE